MLARCRILLLSALLPACSAGHPPPTVYPDRYAWTPEQRIAEETGSDIVNVVGTPFFALFKGVGCVASVLIATPVAVGLGLGDRDDRALIRADLDKGVGANCGGSYVLGSW